jgi:hypothetical protein
MGYGIAWGTLAVHENFCLSAVDEASPENYRFVICVPLKSLNPPII